MDRDLVERVTRGVLLALAPAALAGGLVAGWPGAAGAAAGALISLMSFRWIARAARGAAALYLGGRPGTLWMLGLALRHLTLFGLIAVLLGSGFVHPLGFAVGLSVLPPILIAFGLHAVRFEWGS